MRQRKVADRVLGHYALTKSQLAAMLLDQLGINEREAEGLVESFYEEIIFALETGESLSLAGFGNFEKDAFQPSSKLKALTRNSR